MPSLDEPYCRICWCSFHGSAPLVRVGGRRRSFGSTSRMGWLIPVEYTPPTDGTTRASPGELGGRVQSCLEKMTTIRAMPKLIRGEPESDGADNGPWHQPGDCAHRTAGKANARAKPRTSASPDDRSGTSSDETFRAIVVKAGTASGTQDLGHRATLLAERLRSLAGPAARNVMSRKTVMPARQVQRIVRWRRPSVCGRITSKAVSNGHCLAV
jgi:hypothetical protein